MIVASTAMDGGAVVVGVGNTYVCKARRIIIASTRRSTNAELSSSPHRPYY
jgi:hypothetical protein